MAEGARGKAKQDARHSHSCMCMLSHGSLFLLSPLQVNRINLRMQQLHVLGAVDPGALDHALAPVPDKAYLECLRKLPQPGDQFSSRPGSELSAAKKKTTKKGAKKGTKKRASSAK